MQGEHDTKKKTKPQNHPDKEKSDYPTFHFKNTSFGSSIWLPSLILACNVMWLNQSMRWREVAML